MDISLENAHDREPVIHELGQLGNFAGFVGRVAIHY